MKRPRPTIRDVREVLVRKNPHCAFCNRLLKGDPAPDHAPTAEHVLPRGRGGSDDPDNIILSCRRCNQFRADLTLPEFHQLLCWMVERVSALPQIGGAA